MIAVGVRLRVLAKRKGLRVDTVLKKTQSVGLATDDEWPIESPSSRVVG